MSGQNPVQVPRGNQGDYVTVYDEWLMSPLAQNDHLYAQSPFNENNGVFIGYGLLTISTTPLSIYSTNWCGFQTCPQQWDWGMQKMWIAGFGPYDGSPWNYSPTSLWGWDMRNGNYSQFTQMRDSDSNKYLGDWDWPAPDPRWDTTYNDQVLMTYGDPGYQSHIYFVSKEASQSGSPKIGQVVHEITGPTGTQSHASNGLWWNKPSD